MRLPRERAKGEEGLGQNLKTSTFKARQRQTWKGDSEQPERQEEDQEGGCPFTESMRRIVFLKDGRVYCIQCFRKGKKDEDYKVPIGFNNMYTFGECRTEFIPEKCYTVEA